MIDQLVFGYEDGHRLLAASRPISQQSQALLLGATDADPGDSVTRLVTGVPLKGDDLYALCVTWLAPEMPRPGSVWAHVLLLDDFELETTDDPFSLVELARRPTLESLDQYRQPVRGDHLQNASKTPDADVLAQVLAAAFAADSTREVECQELSIGEAALAKVWRVQWAPLRKRFAFRTRDVVRSGSSTASVTVARRVRSGRKQAVARARASWLDELAGELAADGPDQPFGRFLSTFGPDDKARTSTVEFLGQLFETICAVAVDDVRKELEEHYPTWRPGDNLKMALFKKGSDAWWPAPESARLGSLSRGRSEAWDLDRLEFGKRVVARASKVGLAQTLSDLSDEVPDVVDCVVRALDDELRAADLSALFAWNRTAGSKLLAAHPQLLDFREAWQEVDAVTVDAYLSAVERLSVKAIASSIDEGCIDDVEKSVGSDAVLARLASTPSLKVARSLFEQESWVDYANQSDDDSVVLLAAAARPVSRPSDRLLEALESRRGTPDELWLRAAVSVVASRRRASRTLQAAFGPLHAAITGDRLPDGCWSSLDPVLPSAEDPALRLRLYLVAIAKKEGWDHAALAASLRDAGPYAAQIQHDFSDDDWWVGIVKSVVKGLGLKR